MKSITNSWKRFRTAPTRIASVPAESSSTLEVKVCLTPQDIEKFDQHLQREHYLGKGRPAGDYLRQVIIEDGKWIGLLSWGAACYRIKDREQWIGWTNTQRAERQKLIVQNRRFLLLTPKGSRPNLASQTLGMATKKLPEQWEEAFGYRPVLAETFTDIEQFEGTCYKASGWETVGKSAGYGRHRSEYYIKHDRPKRLWLKKLQTDAREILCAAEVPAVQQKGSHSNAQGQLPLKAQQLRSLREVFEKVVDPRKKNSHFPLSSVLSIIAMALLSGARDVSQIYRYGFRLKSEQRKCLGLPQKRGTVVHPVPGYSVYYEILKRIDPLAFSKTLNDWLQSNEGSLPSALAMDGKMIGNVVGVLSLVHHENGVPVAMTPMNKKEGEQARCEMKAAQALLEEGPPLDGKIITADALHAQKETAQIIVEKGGDYLLQIKGNQKQLQHLAQKQTSGISPLFLSMKKATDAKNTEKWF